MKVLVIGGGGREHAIIKKLSESSKISSLYCMPGNAGIAKRAQFIDIAAVDIEGILSYLQQNKMDLVVVAPDDPLAMGLVDTLNNKGIRAFGPTAAAAKLESSKAFAKQLMNKYGIPTGAFEIFTDKQEVLKYIEDKQYPIVIKASGLALGKGVIIAEDKQQAVQAITNMMQDNVFGESGRTVIIEEYLSGPELSVLAFTDGKSIKTMPSCQDHKRAFDNDKGLNTGGMGAFSPSKFYTASVEQQCMQEIFLPTIEAMNKEGRTFKGVIYFQIMLTKNGPKVIEYNARFGDPETQVLMPLLKTDLLDIFTAVIDEKLEDMDIQWDKSASAVVVAASGGYPQDYKKGYPITGIEEAEEKGLLVYHMGTKMQEGRLVTNGGRVLCVGAVADTVEQAVQKVYNSVQDIKFEGMHYRKDIGKK